MQNNADRASRLGPRPGRDRHGTPLDLGLLTKSVCPWKGLAHHYNVSVDGEASANPAWYYQRPGPPARRFKNHVAFRNGVTVVVVPEQQPGDAASHRTRRWSASLGGTP